MKRIALACMALLSVSAANAQAPGCEDEFRASLDRLNAQRALIPVSVAAARYRAIQATYETCRAANLETARKYFDRLSESAS
jgi:hypothetical protein